MRNLIQIAKEDLINLIKNPMWVFMATGFPVLMALILGYLTEKSYGTHFSSYDFYGITMLLYGAMNSGMISANAFMEERIKKPNMRIIYAPGAISNIFLSKILASFAFSFLFHCFDLFLLHVLVGVNVHHVGTLLVLFGMTDLFFVTLGIMLCCIVKTEMVTNQIQSIIINIIALLGGILFSLEGFGKVVRNISKLSPVKWIIEATFRTIYDYKAAAVLPTILSLGAGVVVMIVVCFLTFQKEDCIC